MIASSTEKIKSARTLAFEALYEIFEKNAYANLTIQRILRRIPLKKEERHLLSRPSRQARKYCCPCQTPQCRRHDRNVENRQNQRQ